MTRRQNRCSLMLVGSVATALTALGVACSTSVTPTPCAGGAGGNGGSGPGGAVSFAADIQPFLATICGGCHSPGGIADLAGIPTRLGEDRTYDMIVSVASVQRADLVLVVPGDSAASLLYRKVSSDSPPVGSRMPLFAPVLCDEQITLIQNWIDQGAENN